MTQKCQLTKIHYYHNNNQIPTISREIFDNHINQVRIERKIFRRQWILKINEIGSSSRDRFQWRLVIAATTGSLLIIIMACFLTYHFLNLHKNDYKEKKPVAPHPPKNNHESMTQQRYCIGCQSRDDAVCLKMAEMDQPECRKAVDVKDPTGCGGFCTINKQYCQLLDHDNEIYQCTDLVTTLKCPPDAFNCGNRCINMSQECDGIVHCVDQSDERNCYCDLTTHFRCLNNISCLPTGKKCNGFVDCLDKSDEIDCQFNNIKCPKGSIACRNGATCITIAHFCDGTQQCEDGSDEPHGCQP